MAKPVVSKNTDFVVRESSGLNFIFAGTGWIMLLVLLFNYSGDNGSTDTVMMLISAAIAAVAALWFTAKGLKRKECIRINRNGLFYYRKFITDWPSLQSVKLTQDDKMFTLQDNFVLILTYTKDGATYLRKISLTNTQDKSEEEILAAVKFYSQL